jgi:hypothetical protein
MNEHQPKYELFKAHDRTDGSTKPVEVLEMEYIQQTDRLIHCMTHGVGFSTSAGDRIKEKPTVVIFLDKSARPVSWLVRELWDTLAPEPGSDEIPEQPDFKFLNIDRSRLRKKLDPNGTGGFDASYFSEDQIIGLRSIFNQDHDGSFDAPNILDNQRIMIVDEVLATGATMEMTQSLLKRAFPTSALHGEHWMGKVGTINGATGNADLPIWFDSHIETGRGVGDALPDDKITDPAQLFLSRRFPVPDEKALMLRQDFKTLARSMGKSVLYLPHLDRDLDSLDPRSMHVNGKSYIDSMLERRSILDSHKEKSGTSRRR